MITLICKRIPITVNKEMHKNEQSHEMTQFRTESPPCLHCTNRYWSTAHPMDRSSNCLCIGCTTSTNLDRIRVSCNGSRSPQHATEQSRTHVYIYNTYGTYTLQTRAHRQAYAHTNTYSYTLHIHIRIHTQPKLTCTYTHACINTITQIKRHTHKILNAHSKHT